MTELDRRRFVGSLALAGLIPAGRSNTVAAQAPVSSIEVPADVTRQLARYVVRARPEELSEAVRKEARRTVVNWVGCAIGGARHQTLDIAVSVLAPYAEITDRLGERYEILLNTYKPFACGIVLHPAIDACIQLRDEYRLTPEHVERIELSVHPLVLELTGKRTPQTGLEGKFSIYFAAAVAVAAGAAGVKQFTDEWVRNPAVVSLRDRVVATAGAGIGEAQVRAVIVLRDGRRLEKFVEQAVGSVEHPMTDANLEAKFLDLADGALPSSQARRLLALSWDIENLPDAANLARAASA